MKTKNYGDEKSKDLFTKALIKKGFEVDDADNYDANGKPLPDLYGERNGIKYKFELKQRECYSDQWEDILISEHKLKLQSNYSRLYFVFFYADGVGFIVNPEKQEYHLEKKYTSKTTRFEDGSKSYEWKAIFKQDEAYRFNFTPETIYEPYQLEKAEKLRRWKQKRDAN